MIKRYIQKIKAKIREGFLKEMWSETRWIYGYTAQYRSGIIRYILLGLLLTAAGLIASVVSKHLIDAVTSQNREVIVLVILLYLFFNILRMLLNALIQRMSARLGVKASNEIRADVFRRFMTVDWQSSLNYHSGDLLNRVSSDVATVASSVLGWIPSLVTCLFQFLATLGMILYYDPIMAALALFSAPVTVLMSRVLISRMRSFDKEVRESQTALIAFYEESLQNLQAVKAFNLHGRMSSRLDRLQDDYKDVSLRYNQFSVKTNLLMSFMGFAVSCLCMAWGVYRLWSGRISFGTMILFIQLAGMVSGAFSSLISLVPSAISATVSAGRIMTILSLPQENLEADSETRALLSEAAVTGAGISISDIHFSYQNGRGVLNGFSLEAKPGGIIGIVSPSGGGKTTLIRLLLGLMAPQQGSMQLCTDSRKVPLSAAARSLVTYVAQEKVVFSGTIADCLRLSEADASEEALIHALNDACAWDFVSALPEGLNTELGERGSGLSEGQIQRLAIARAILSPAPILLLDEATSALDIDTEKKVLENILQNDSRRTVLVTTHRPTVLKSCTRVYAIKEGRSVLLSEAEIQTFGR